MGVGSVKPNCSHLSVKNGCKPRSLKLIFNFQYCINRSFGVEFRRNALFVGRLPHFAIPAPLGAAYCFDPQDAAMQLDPDYDNRFYKQSAPSELCLARRGRNQISPRDYRIDVDFSKNLLTRSELQCNGCSEGSTFDWPGNNSGTSSDSL